MCEHIKASIKTSHFFILIFPPLFIYLASGLLVAQRLKDLRAMRETWVWSLSGEDALEKGKATHSSILA